MPTRIFSQLVPAIAIDAGTDRIRIWSSGAASEVGPSESTKPSDRLFQIDEATCLAVERKTGRVVQVGDEAHAMEGRVGDDIAVLHPVRRGEVTDLHQFRALLQLLLQKITSPFALARPIMMMAVPSHLSPAKRQKMSDLLHGLGASEAYTISQSLASAIGSGVPIADATGSFVMHCGAGLVEASVISLGTSVADDSTWFAGHWLDEYLQTHLKQTRGLIISIEMARQLKEQLVILPAGSQSKLVSGRDLRTSSPREISVSGEELDQPVQLFVRQYELLLRRLLAQLPPELSVDVIDKGLLLSGGLAELSGLDETLRLTLGVPVSVVEQPTQTVILGLKTALQHIDEFKHSLGYRRGE